MTSYSNNNLEQLCERCESTDAERRRQNTFYPDEEDNYVTLCPQCHKDNESYWEDMWIEYYSSQGLGYYKKD